MGFSWVNSDCGVIPKFRFGKAPQAHSGQSSSFLQVKVSGHFLSSSLPSHSLFPGKGHQAFKCQSSPPTSPERVLALQAQGSGPAAASCHRAGAGKTSCGLPSQSPLLAKRWSPKKTESARTGPFHLPEGYSSSAKLFVSVFKHIS